MISITRKTIAINAGALLGILASALVVPGETPFWIWGSVALVAIVILNVAIQYREHRSNGMASGPREASGTRIGGHVSLLVCAALLYLIYAVWHR